MLDRNPISLSGVKPIVSYVWNNEGLKYPPTIEKLTRGKNLGEGCRYVVRFRDPTYTWIVLHELAHSMTSTINDMSNYHGAFFVGMYMRLLNKYLKIPLDRLIYEANRYRLKYELDVKPFV
jgi:hypothetical protein